MKLAAAVARQIEQDIIESGWNEGELLGTEDQLVDLYGVSRATLREAVRILDHSGLVEMRRGPHGGIVVGCQATEAVVGAMVACFEFSDVTLGEIFEARRCIEALAVELCMECEHVASLSTAVETAETEDEVHVEIARRSGNAALGLFVDALVRLTESRRLERLGSEPEGNDADALSKLVAAIEDHNLPVAVTALHQRLQRRCDEVTQLPLRSGADRMIDRIETGAGRRLAVKTLAEIVATMIRRDIAWHGWPEGWVIGSEAELLEKFGVSRSALREAVRILEHYNVATMRRGPGGGLMVTRPDQSRVVDTTSRYLKHINFRTSDLHAIRDAVERYTAGLAAERITPVGAARLMQGLERERQVDPDDINSISHNVHGMIADLAGNRFLSFCTEVLTRITAGHVEPSRLDRDSVVIAGEINTIHSRIVDAIVHGDGARAARLMGRHLDAVLPYIELRS